LFIASPFIYSVNIKQLLEQQLEREHQRHANPTRASEGLYALCMDNQFAPKMVLRELETISIYPETIAATQRLFLENENLEVLTRERLLARRSFPRADALSLARAADLEGLRRLTGKDLQLGLRAASVLEAKPMIEAWNALSVYEQTRG
jgi:hypothetical protein